jgi:prepilin-type N-terminal cleavage/methylation domain-containing protein/prepilin-type processing-associated H-X9-DG protein
MLTRVRPRGFTLAELLVVIAIIVGLLALLVPAISRGLVLFRGTKSLSNLRQLNAGLRLYTVDHHGFYPAAVYPPVPPAPRFHWCDAILDHVDDPSIFLSPQLNAEEVARMTTPFASVPTSTFGGYGYNYQYLGNGRFNTGWSAPWNTPFHGKVGVTLVSDSRTVSISDTDGTKAERVDNAGGQTMASPWTSNGTFTIDPPLASKDLGSRGSRRVDGGPTRSRNYGNQGGGDGVLLGEGGATRSTPGDPVCRATPAGRSLGRVNMVFCDGHTDALTPEQLDDSDGDGSVDNGLWNGQGRANVR